MNDAIDLSRTDERAVRDDVTDEVLEEAASPHRMQAATWICTNIWWCGPGGL